MTSHFSALPVSKSKFSTLALSLILFLPHTVAAIESPDLNAGPPRGIHAPGSCDIDPADASNPLGERHSITVTVRNADGSVAPGVDVTLEIIEGPNSGTTATFDTDANGQVEVSYKGVGGEGTDTIEARGSVEDVPFSCTATKNWTPPQPRCSIEPQSETNVINTEHQVTVTVTFGGTLQPGVDVTLTVLSGPNAGDSAGATTDDSGQVAIAYTGDGGAGTDAIQASGTINGDPFSCMAARTWILPPAVCSISPASASNPVGARHDLTVTVTRDGVPQAGVGVRVDITSGPNSSQRGTIVTAQNGQISLSYVSNGLPGTDSITASGSVGGFPFSCDAVKTWIVLTPTPTSSPTPSATVDVTPCDCVGDCGCDGRVTVDEVVVMVSIALGVADVAACPAGDPSGDHEVTVDEILLAITNALEGCGSRPGAGLP